MDFCKKKIKSVDNPTFLHLSFKKYLNFFRSKQPLAKNLDIGSVMTIEIDF